MKDAAQVREFERLEQQLHSLLNEIRALSNKKANDGLNPFKLKFTNILLAQLNKFLASAKPFKDFDEFDEKDVPTNSDAVVILSQYAAAIFISRSQNTVYAKYKWRWLVEGEPTEMITSDPTHFKFGAK